MVSASTPTLRGSRRACRRRSIRASAPTTPTLAPVDRPVHHDPLPKDACTSPQEPDISDALMQKLHFLVDLSPGASSSVTMPAPRGFPRRRSTEDEQVHAIFQRSARRLLLFGAQDHVSSHDPDDVPDFVSDSTMTLYSAVDHAHPFHLDGHDIHRYFSQKISFRPADTRVLCVERGPPTVATMLRNAGYQVSCARNEVDAWCMLEQSVQALAADHDRRPSHHWHSSTPPGDGRVSLTSGLGMDDAELQFHIVISDAQPGDIKDSGERLLSQLRSHPMLCDLPFIMMVSSDEMEAAYACLRAGADDYLLKPVRSDAVKNVWRSVWRKRKEKKIAVLLEHERRRRVTLERTVDHLQHQAILASETPLAVISRTVQSLLDKTKHCHETQKALATVMETLTSVETAQPSSKEFSVKKLAHLDPATEQWLAREILGDSGITDFSLQRSRSRSAPEVKLRALWEANKTMLRKQAEHERKGRGERRMSLTPASTLSPEAIEEKRLLYLRRRVRSNVAAQSLETVQEELALAIQKPLLSPPVISHTVASGRKSPVLTRPKRPSPLSLTATVVNADAKEASKAPTLLSAQQHDTSTGAQPLTPFIFNSGFSLPSESEHINHYTPNSFRLSLLQSWSFDVWSYAQSELIVFFLDMMHDLGFFREFSIDTTTVIRFLRLVQSNYQPTNPYHNFSHCFDVTHAGYLLLKEISQPSSEFPGLSTTAEGEPVKEGSFSPLERLSFFIACVCHDLGHDGRSNNFHIKTESELALRYNDRSVLENFHAAEAFRLLREHPEADFLVCFNRETRQEIRRLMIRFILATDLGRHVELLAEFNRMIPQALQPSHWQEKRTREQVLELVIKCADVSNTIRPLHLATEWSKRVQEEMFLQGDQERQLSLSISAFADRSEPNQARLGVSFADFMVLPLYQTLTRALPQLQHHIRSLLLVREHFFQQLPSAEQGTKSVTINTDTVVMVKRRVSDTSEDDRASVYFSAVDFDDSDPSDWSEDESDADEPVGAGQTLVTCVSS